MKSCWTVPALLALMPTILPPAGANPARPHPYRFDPRGGHPALTLGKDCPPGTVTFRAIGETPDRDRVLRTLRAPGGPARFELPTVPGAAAVSISLQTVEGGKTLPGAEYRALNPPQKLEDWRGDPQWKEPADWRAYWDRAKADLAKIPMNPRVVEVPEKASATGRLYRVELDSLGGVRIVCWLTVPKDTSRTYPAVQTMPGYGAAQGPDDRTAQGYITFAVNPRGHGASAEFWPLPKNHLEQGITDPEAYYYRGAYMDCYRAMQFLRNRPEVDTSRIATEGSSQGGALSLATAALDGHVAACGAYVPFLSDLPTAVRMCTNGGYQGLRARWENPASQEGAAIRKTLSYIDARFMAAHVKCPTMITVALMDRTCPPATGIADYNNLPAGIPKKLVFDPAADHELTDLMVDAVHRWFDQRLGVGG